MTTSGGHSPIWSPDGRELYFRRDRLVLAIGVSLDSRGIHVGRERVVFEWDAGRFGYAVGPQGEFYGFESEPGAAIQSSVQIQTGWFATIQRLAGQSAAR